MTELTTERLEKFIKDIESEGMCDITDSGESEWHVFESQTES